MRKQLDNKEAVSKPELYTVLGVVRVRMQDFMIHLDTRKYRLEFEVYPVQDWTQLQQEKKERATLIKKMNLMKDKSLKKVNALKNLKARFVGVAYGKADFTLLMKNIGVKILKSCQDYIMTKLCRGVKTLLRIENLTILTMISITPNV